MTSRREKLTRTLGAVIAVAGFMAMYSDLSNFAAMDSWMDWGRIAGMVVLLIAFAVYAIAGTGPANRILKIITLPDRLGDSVMRRLVRDEDHDVIGLERPKDKSLPTSGRGD